MSPSGKASDSDSDSTWVRILPPEPLCSHFEAKPQGGFFARTAYASTLSTDLYRYYSLRLFMINYDKNCNKKVGHYPTKHYLI